jgi:predicted nucleotidyltransferase
VSESFLDLSECEDLLDTESPDRLYEEAAHLLDSPAFDLDQAGAWLLGQDARRLLSSGQTPELAIGFAAEILQRESLEEGALQLASEMCPANRV